MDRQLRHPSIIGHLPLQWMPTPAATTTTTIVRAREVVLEEVAAVTQDAMATGTRSLSTRLSTVQEKGSSEVAGGAAGRGTKPQDQQTRHADGDRGPGWHCYE